MFADQRYTVSFLHGKLSPAERDYAMKEFRAGRTKVNKSVCLSICLSVCLVVEQAV
jgi:RecG-like helicase